MSILQNAKTWDVHTDTPVIAPEQIHGKFDASRAGAAHVVQIGDMYRMVYWATDDAGSHHILQAEAPVETPNAWRPLGGPLISAQKDTQHNCDGPSFPFLLPVTESHWLLYFCAWGSRDDGKLPNTTGVAISEDAGDTWRYHDTHPVISCNMPYDKEGTGSVWVILENGKFRMYYTSIGCYFDRPEGARTGHGDTIPRIGIAYAESDDGLTWEKPYDDWLVRPREFDVEPYEYICSKPCIVKIDSEYVLWVNTFGTAYRVHSLCSSDGIEWTWRNRIGPDGELGAGKSGSFDDHQRSYPTIVRHGHELRCWFTGNSFGATGMGYATST